MNLIPEAVINRLEQLSEEAEAMDKIQRLAESDQIGTSIPRHFFEGDTFTVNPSAISAGMLLRMIESDETFLSSVEFKILMLVSKIGDYHHDNEEIKTFVQNFLKNLRKPSWIETLESMGSAYIVGYSVSEVVYGVNEDLQKVPVRVPTYHPSTIAFETDLNGQITEHGILQFVQQSTMEQSNPNEQRAVIRRNSKIKNPFVTPLDYAMPVRLPFFNNWGMVRIPRSKVVHIVNKQFMSFGSPYGKTAVRAAHLAWQMKIFFMKHLGVAGKKQGTPTIVGQAPQEGVIVQLKKPDGSVEEMTPQKAMIKMLSDRESNDAIVVGSEKEGYKVTVINNGANLDQFLNVINQMNVYIFRAFLLPSLVMTDGSAGSRSLGEKHFDIVNQIAQVDAKKFTGAIINDMIEPVIIENFGLQDNYGKFQERPGSLEELEKMANIFSTLTDTGYLSPGDKEDFKWVRETIGAPKGNPNLFGEEGEGEEEV